MLVTYFIFIIKLVGDPGLKFSKLVDNDFQSMPGTWQAMTGEMEVRDGSRNIAAIFHVF